MIFLKALTTIMLFAMTTCLCFEFARERKTELPIFERYVYLYMITTLGLAMLCIWV